MTSLEGIYDEIVKIVTDNAPKKPHVKVSLSDGKKEVYLDLYPCHQRDLPMALYQHPIGAAMSCMIAYGVENDFTVNVRSIECSIVVRNSVARAIVNTLIERYRKAYSGKYTLTKVYRILNKMHDMPGKFGSEEYMELYKVITDYSNDSSKFCDVLKHTLNKIARTHEKRFGNKL